MKMKKSISFVLVLSMLLAAMLGVTSVAEAELAAAKLDISYANLMFTDSVYPLFAVDYTAVYTGDKAEASALAAIKLEVYRNGELVDTLSPSSEELGAPAGTIPFKQESFGFKNMGDIYTYRAVNGKAENTSDDVEYSVLEYALESSMLGNDKLATVVEKMIAVGASAQAAFGYKDYNYDLTKKYSVTKLAGGATFADGTTKKIFVEGDTSTYVASHNLAAEKVVWYNNTLELQSTESTFTASYGESQTLFAVPAAQAVAGSITKGAQVKTEFTAAVVDIVGDFANNGNASAQDTFTLSFAIATNSATGSTKIELRNTAYMSTGSSGNVNQYNGATKCGVSLWSTTALGHMGTRYSDNKKGVCVNSKNPEAMNLAPMSMDVAAGSKGDYVMVSIVFDLDADCPLCTSETGCDYCNLAGSKTSAKNGRTPMMYFYVDGVQKMSTILPVNLSYTVSGEDKVRYYFDNNLAISFTTFSNLYIKDFTVVPGDINDYK